MDFVPYVLIKNCSGAAGACAGCDGITTAQKLSEGTQNFDILSYPILSTNRTTHTLDGEVEENVTKWSFFIWENSKEF